MVLPALRQRRAPGEAPRRPAADVPPLARVLPHVAAGGRAAALVSVLARGDTAVPRPETLADLEVARDRGSRAPRGGEPGARGAPGATLSRERRLRGDARGARAIGRLLPPPAPRSCGRRAARSRSARPPPGPAAARARGLGRRLGLDHPAARRHLAARGDRQLPRHRGGRGPAARGIAAGWRGAVARRTFGSRRSRRSRRRGSESAASGRTTCTGGWSRSPPGRPAPGRPPRAAR